MGVFSENAIIGASNPTGYDIDYSLRLNSPDSAYLSRVIASAGNRKTSTHSAWVKIAYNSFDRDDTGTTPYFTLFSSGNSDQRWNVGIADAGTNFGRPVLHISNVDSGGSQSYKLTTEQVFRDPNAWYHIVVVMDTTASQTDRIQIYVNGERVTAYTTASWPSSSLDTDVFRSADPNCTYNVGSRSNSTSAATHFWDGYIAEVHVVDGTALTAASFGETNEDTGQWVPKQVAGISYGTNGFYLDFSNSSSLGADAAGSNDLTPSNLAATDQVVDTPTNNFATMSAHDTYNNVAPGSFNTSTSAAAINNGLTEGMLYCTETGGNAKGTHIGNMGMESGKWYWEFCGVNSDNTWMVGIGDIYMGLSRGYTGSSGNGYYVYVDGDLYSPTSNTSYGVSWTYGDVIGVALDMDNGALYFAKNGTWMNSGDPTSGSSKTGAAVTSGLTGRTWAACMGRGSTNNTIKGVFNFGQDSSFAGQKTAQGNQDGNLNGDFYYTPPTGYLAQCAKSFSPTIEDPRKHFNTVLYTGSGAGQSISGVGFQPDFTWIKNRDTVVSHALFDSVRGATKYLTSDATVAESTESDMLTAFNSDGFSGGGSNQVNIASDTYASWNWLAGGTAVSNTDGSLTTSVSANTTAGFSIISYTGDDTQNSTIGHGLSQAPELAIFKPRGSSSNEWTIWMGHITGTYNEYLYLNTTAALASSAYYFGTSGPVATASTLKLGESGRTNNSASPGMICYAFHSVAGYSRVGKYSGNGIENGGYFWTGFRPAFVFIKRISNAGSNSYLVDNKRVGYNNFRYDTDNGSNKYVWPDSSAAEGNGTASKGIGMDILSNGIKFRTAGSDYQASGNEYLVYAVAEFPFRYANAR